MTNRSFAFRSTARAVIAGQFLLLSSDLLAAQAEDRKKPAKPAPPQAVKVNRTLPKVTPPPQRPQFSAQPTDDELFRARVFAEPLVPVGGATQSMENAALAGALLAFVDEGQGERTSAVETFLVEHPRSPWRASLLANLGVVYRRTGYYTRALQAWEQAWSIAKADETDPGRAVADTAVGELLALKARLGRLQELESLLEEIAGRDLRGGATERAAGAREAVWMMKNRTGEAFRCGPLALERILAYGKPAAATPSVLANAQSTLQGTSLTQIEGLAHQAGLSLRKAKREGPGSAVPIPAVVHWKAGHFAAILKEEAGRYLVQDPTFGEEIWLTGKALLDEGSGYYLVPRETTAAGWPAVTDEEGAGVWGRGAPLGSNAGSTGPNNTTAQPGSCAPPPMAVYNFHVMLASLNVTDTPLRYSPPRGPAIAFRVAYNQREAFQPALFSFSNLGRKWAHDWLSYVEDDPNNGSQPARVYTRGGGVQDYTGYNSGTQSYAVQTESQTVLVRTATSPIRYERRHNDGSVEVFAQPDGAFSAPRRVFLTESRDAQGNALALTYDAQLRLVAITDAIGQVTTLSYELPSDPLKITKVTDPFGRLATFEYTAGRLTKITDLIGITSQFAYGTNDFIYSLTTPYGTSSFGYGENTGATAFRWVEAVDPLGGRERVEYDQFQLGISNTDPPATIPAGITPAGDLANGTSFYWDKRAMALYPLDVTKAKQWHWMRQASSVTITADVAEATKNPLENRVWNHYPGQTFTGTPVHAVQGTTHQPDRVARVLDDGTTQTYLTEYNAIGRVIKAIDPLGRETVYVHGNNNTPDPTPATGSGIDLLQVKQKNPASPGGYDLLSSSTYNSQHQPLTTTDASGQTTTYTYNAQGQVLTIVTPPRAGLTLAQRTTTYSYDTNGYLQSVTGPETGATTGFTYDSYGRVQTVTDPDGYVLTYDYDALDRVTKVTYPDATFEETVYNKLDAERHRDRLGRWSHTFHDAVRRPIAMRDPLGRTVTQQWCTCGSLDKLIDANGNGTSWERDLQARVTKETRADGSFKTSVYENTTSRLKQVTDAKSQIIGYTYFKDDNLKDITYTNEVISTQNVGFTYDANYNRMATMVDGTGTTTYGYNAVGQPPALGAAQLATVDGPLANDVVAYGYDELGRVTTRTIDGAANSQTMTYDSLGRVTNATNLLGTFGYTYEGVTGRPSSVSHPSGQTTTLAFETNVGDRRLKEIWHKLSGGATLSKFNYTTDAVANIKTWTQPPNVYEFGYDAADQLASAVLKGPGRTPPILKRYGYGYDKAGNRTTEQIDDAATASSHDNMNRLTSQQAGGALTVAGTLNEPATVTVQGKPATVSATNAFEGRAQVTSGTNTVVVQATDPSGNVRTNTYEVNQSGANKTLTYDGNGNMTGDGTRTFEWDAENRLIAVVQGALRSEFTYDGIGRRVRIVEKDGAATTSDKRILWCGVEICEERDSSGGTGVKRFFGQGVQDGGAAFFYARDHLGSIRDVTDSAGTIRARYDYDPWGRRTKLAGDKDADFGYTGHYEHVPTSLTLAPFRAYDSNVGRWTSEDPMGLDDGPNRYAYVFGRPVNATDPLGLVAGVDDAAYLAVGLMALMTLVAVAMVATKSPPALPPFPTTDPMPPGPPPQTPTPRPAPGPPPNVGTGTGTGTSTTMSPPSNVLPFPPRPQPTACATPTPRPPTVCSLVKGPYIKPPGGKWCQYSCIKDRKIIPLEIGPVPNGVPCDPTVILN